MLRMRASAPAILAVLAVAATVAARAAPAGEDCLAGPNAQAPQGSHWFYRLDRATHKKCWFLGPQTAKARRAAPAKPVTANPPAPPVAAAAAEAPASPTPAAAAGVTIEEAAFALRWPAQVGVADAADRAGASDSYAAEPAPAPVPDTIKPTPVRTTAELAGQPAAAPARTSALPAALAGVALVLAAVGAILVRAGRRAAAERRPEEARSPGERVARHPGIAVPAYPPAFAGVMRATSDIAAATLQPDIAPLPPEPIAAAPDAEQSLRQLLRDWEHRAA